MGAGWLASLDSRIVRGVTVVDEGVLSQMGSLIAGILSNYQRIDKSFPETAAIAESVYTNIYLPAKMQLDELNAIKERGQQLAALNRYSKFRGSPDYFEGVGNEKLVLIDTSGVPKVFEPMHGGLWLPACHPERLYERLETVD